MFAMNSSAVQLLVILHLPFTCDAELKTEPVVSFEQGNIGTAGNKPCRRHHTSSAASYYCDFFHLFYDFAFDFAKVSFSAGIKQAALNQDCRLLFGKDSKPSGGCPTRGLLHFIFVVNVVFVPYFFETAEYIFKLSLFFARHCHDKSVDYAERSDKGINKGRHITFGIEL